MAPIVQLDCQCGGGYLRPDLVTELDAVTPREGWVGATCLPYDHAHMTGEFEEIESLFHNCLIEHLNHSAIVKTITVWRFPL